MLEISHLGVLEWGKYNPGLAGLIPWWVIQRLPVVLWHPSCRESPGWEELGEGGSVPWAALGPCRRSMSRQLPVNVEQNTRIKPDPSQVRSHSHLPQEFLIPVT